MSPLPAITAQTTIDATTQPGFTNNPIVEVFGGNIGSADGLLLAAGADSSTIKGLDLAGFSGAGIHVQSNNDLIVGNFLGTDTTGIAAGPGNVQGVLIDTGAGTTVGGTAASSANTIGFNGAGIVTESDGDTVIGNLIGTDALGDNLGNTFGVSLLSSNNTVSANVIGWSSTNVFIQAADTGNSVLGNFIGTDSAGHNLGVAGSYGVRVLGTGNTIGGAGNGAGNTVGFNSYGVSLEGTGNQVLGNFIGTDATGDNRTNAIGVAIVAMSNTVAGNTIGFSSTAGLSISGDDALVTGNFIGTDSTGKKNLGNTTGISIGASNATIGGTTAGAGNTIGFSSLVGVSVVFGSNNAIQGNTYDGSSTAEPSSTSDISLAPGANNDQVAPTLISASVSSGMLSVVLTLPDLVLNTSIDLYEDNSATLGQRTYLGTFNVTSASQVSNPLTATVTATVATGATILATATVPPNGTSAFSTPLTLVGNTVVQNLQDDGPNSLRDAIRHAEDPNSPTHTVTFDISPSLASFPTTFPFIEFVIPLASPLDIASPVPGVTSPITIDGFSEATSLGSSVLGFTQIVPLVVLDGGGISVGSNQPPAILGIEASAAGTVVQGLVFNSSTPNTALDSAILIRGNKAASLASGTQILGNYIGTDVTAEDTSNTGQPLGFRSGIELDGSSFVTIGGYATLTGTAGGTVGVPNVISGMDVGVGPDGTGAQEIFDGEGIVLIDQSNNNLIQNDYVGTDLSGSTSGPAL